MHIRQLLDLAIAKNASDLHLVYGYPPALRIDSALDFIHGTNPLTDEDIVGLVLPLLYPAQKRMFESTYELDFAIPYQKKARFRVNLFREQGHVSAAFRLLPLVIPKLESLGLPVQVYPLSELRQGFILVTGPTGHGKSTTLAAILNKINETRPARIITIEDPIEYVFPQARGLVSQREMLVDTKSWSNALRAALREDPDAVMVGEMRDYETIAAAITIAETGHLVFASLHTNSAAQAVDRIIDVFPEQQQSQVRSQIAATLEAVISQRLIPTLGPGRALAVELLMRTPALASMIRDGKTHLIDNLIQTSAEFGMIPMEASLARLVQEGRVSIETAQNYCLHTDVLEKLVGGFHASI